ncbi:MAG: hypothetical protein KGY76_04920 [Candidatus Thermoplasmatota archaeon]|nr:hypothetical protein [Candidatus Thermoplasmatota archaeon]
MLKFIIRATSKITVCDYCRFHKRSWTKYEPGNLPSNRPEDTSFKIADEYIEKAEFKSRTDIAKKIGSFDPERETWHFNPAKGSSIGGYELKEIIDEQVNKWSKENDLRLSDLVDYKEKGFEKLG